MKKNNHIIEYSLLFIGVLLAITGGYKIITTGRLNAAQDEVFEEIEGFAPVLVPLQANYEDFSVNNNLNITLQAPEVDFQAVPIEVEITPDPLVPTLQPTEESIVKGPAIPDRIVIPEIALDAPIVEAGTRQVRVDGLIYEQFTAPDEFAVGWHPDSAYLGEVGNTVLNGHHNVFGEVFARLVDLEPGNIIYLFSNDSQFGYIVVNKMILPELGENVSIQQRLENARWIMASQDERLTLVTCWPAYSNTHRLIIVAKPIKLDLIPSQ